MKSRKKARNRMRIKEIENEPTKPEIFNPIKLRQRDKKVKKVEKPEIKPIPDDNDETNTQDQIENLAEEITLEPIIETSENKSKEEEKLTKKAAKKKLNEELRIKLYNNNLMRQIVLIFYFIRIIHSFKIFYLIKRKVKTLII